MKWILISAAVLLVYIWIMRLMKIPKLGNMVLITGGVKTGKTTLSVWLSKRVYKKNLRAWRIYTYFIRYLLFWLRLPKREKPLYYSNIPVKVENFCFVNNDLLLRKVRPRYKSVIYICESSLVCDSQYVKDPFTNENMLLLNKLIAHETKGGSIFYDTQSISDNHYAVKRCLSSYLYVHHTVKIPFFCLMWVRENAFSEDGSVSNVNTSDVEDDLRLIVVPKKVWKLFDCYCYSALTDDLPVKEDVSEPAYLKVKVVPSLRKFQTVKTSTDGSIYRGSAASSAVPKSAPTSEAKPERKPAPPIQFDLKGEKDDKKQ